jgi:hypothetical protein
VITGVEPQLQTEILAWHNFGNLFHVILLAQRLDGKWWLAVNRKLPVCHKGITMNLNPRLHKLGCRKTC